MQYTKYLRWAILGLLGVTLLLPFVIADGSVFPNMFFPYITGKNFAFRILVELIAGLYVLLALREPKYRPRASVLMWLLVAFTAWMAIATATSVDPIKSFWSNFERMEGYLTILHLFVYCVIASAVVTAEGWWNNIFRISVAASAIEGVYAFMQVVHLFGFAPSSQSGARADGTFGNATYLAVYMLINIFITLYLLASTKRTVAAQICYGLALVLQVVALYYTETRGALLGLLVGLIVAAIWIAWKARQRELLVLRRTSLGVLVAIVVIVVGFIAIKNTSFVQHSSTLQRFASISLQDPTTQSRFYIWHMALQGFVEKPILGWGQENFNFVFNKFYVPAMYNQEQWFDRAHNAFLDWLIAGGFPAFALYIALFAGSIWFILRSRLNVVEQALLIGLLFGYAFNNLFVFDNLLSYIYFFLIIAFVHGLSINKPQSIAWSKPASPQTMAIAAPIVLVLVGLGIWTINIPGIARAEGLLNAVITSTPVQTATGVQGEAKDPQTNLTQFQQVLAGSVWPGTPLGKQETVEQMLEFATSNIAPSTSATSDLKQQFYTATLNAATSFMATRPHDARLELFTGTFLSAFGQYPQALQYLNMALTDSPSKQETLFELGITDINSGNIPQALAYLKQAYEEAPAYGDAQIMYAVALYYDNQEAQGDALLMQYYGTVLVNDPRILQVYIDTKQFSRVIGIWQEREAADPNDSQTHIGLAAAYFEAGNTAQAIIELQKAAQIDPTLAPEVQATIQQIQSGALKP